MEQDVPASQPQASDAPRPQTACKLFLGGLSWETDEAKLMQHFQKYGQITGVLVMRDRINNKPRGFGFITFADEAAARSAMNDSHVVDGRAIDAKPSVPQGDQYRPRSKKIFVGGLAPDTNEADFKAFFDQFGNVVEAQIMVDHNSMRSRGFGFITFEDEASVHKVFAAGSHHQLGGKFVEVKSATPKGSGPQGRGGGGMDPRYPGGRGMQAGRGGYGDLPAAAYGVGPHQYMPAGYLLPGYGGHVPYGAFPGLPLPLGGYGYPGYAPGYGMGAFSPYGQVQQQQQQQPSHQAPPAHASSSRAGPTGIPLRGAAAAGPPAQASGGAGAGAGGAQQHWQPPGTQQRFAGGAGGSSSSGGVAPGPSGGLEQLQQGMLALALDPGQQQQTPPPQLQQQQLPPPQQHHHHQQQQTRPGPGGSGGPGAQ